MSTIPARRPVNGFTTSTRQKASDQTPRPSISHSRHCTLMDVEGRASHAPTISIPLLREAIDTLDTRMATLMSRRHELETHLERAVRLQSPVSRLPSELLSSIFVMGVFGIGEEDPVMVSTLMLVCRYWSEVALNTPALWTKIFVTPHDSLEKTRRKLDRSKSCPLDISINFEPRMYSECATSIIEHVTKAMELVRPALWRTRSFRLSVPNRPQAHAALLRCQEDAPLLDTLSIHIHHSMQDDTYSSPLLPLFNGHTPRLKSCSFTSFNFGWDHRLISNLRVLKLGGYFNAFTPSVTTLLSVLRQCPELEELALRNISSVDSDTCRSDDLVPLSLSKLIQLRRLTKISFYYSGIGLTRQIMTHIAFPNLECLEMCYLEDVTPVLQPLYSQASTHLPLLHLSIESCSFNEIKFVNLLRRLPSLLSLELLDIDDNSCGFMKGLSSQPWICPRLEVLNVEGCTTFDWDSLRSLVESRLSAPTSSSHSSLSASCVTTSVHSGSRVEPRIDQPPPSSTSRRLRAIDVTRCNQISREMVQWLRMYVADVKCEPAKGVWG